MPNTIIIQNQSASPLVMTTTGELFMPTRIYYRIHSKNALFNTLKKLKCVTFTKTGKPDFLISYFKEAKYLDLETHYQDVPSELYPVALAECHFKQDSILCVDLRSLRRGVEIFGFLAKHINQNIMAIQSFAHTNVALAAATQAEVDKITTCDYDVLFNYITDTIEVQLKDEFVNTIKKHNFEKEMLYEFQMLYGSAKSIMESEKKAYPEVEKINIQHNGFPHHAILDALFFRATIKETVALRRFEGQHDYCSRDAILEHFDESLA